jgi:acetyl-CoA synthetase
MEPIMSDELFQPRPEVAASAHIDAAKYAEMYKRSIDDPEGFWAEHGKRVDWIKPFTKVKNVSYDKDNLSIKWFEMAHLTCRPTALIGT